MTLGGVDHEGAYHYTPMAPPAHGCVSVAMDPQALDSYGPGAPLPDLVRTHHWQTWNGGVAK